MAFLLRNISYSADGRQIVRSSRVADDLLKVGRDPDSDIRLNDLAVALHHATLELVSASRLGVSAEAGLTVELDGNNTQFGQIDTATGGTKSAKLETGAVVQVPLFLNEGDVIRVDRREDKYMERANK